MAHLGTGNDAQDPCVDSNYDLAAASTTVANENAFYLGPVWLGTNVGSTTVNEWHEAIPSKQRPVCYWG